MAIVMPMMTTLMSGLSLAIYWIGANLINAAQAMDRLTIFSNMVVFSSYAVQVIMSFMMLVMIFILLPRASVSAKRINEVLDTKPVIMDGDKKMGKQVSREPLNLEMSAFNIRELPTMFWRTLVFRQVRVRQWHLSALTEAEKVR